MLKNYEKSQFIWKKNLKFHKRLRFEALRLKASFCDKA